MITWFSPRRLGVPVNPAVHQAPPEPTPPTLIAIETNGPILRFVFLRNGEKYVCETYGAFDADVIGWRRDLIE